MAKITAPNLSRAYLEYEQLYLTFVRACITLKDYTSLYRAKCIYHYQVMTRTPTIGSLKPSGVRGSVMFVGLNPSHHSNLEDVWQDKFGELMNGLFTEVGINKEHVWMTNLYKKPTINNRPLTEGEISEGKMLFQYEAGTVNPTLIVAMGTQVMQALGAKHGEITRWKIHKVIGCLHPSVLHRIPTRRKEVTDVFKVAKKYIHVPTPPQQ